MRRILAWLVVICAAVWCSPHAGQAARPFPDTTEGIWVFSDQLPDGLTAAQRAFAASHLAGAQKLTRSLTDALRADNPDFIMIDYMLAWGMGNHSHIEGDEWIPDDLAGLESGHPDWFITHPSSPHPSQRVWQTDWEWWLLDAGHAGWQGYFVTETLRRRALNASDGVFADSAVEPWNMSPEVWWPAGTDMFAFWDPRANSWLSAVAGALSSQANPVYLIPNAGSLVTTLSVIDFALADGVMVEGFAMWGAGDPFELADWQLQMDRILALVQAERAVICQSYVDPGDIAFRMFNVACYLLVKGPRSFLFLTDGDIALQWFPEYGIDIGAYERVPTSAADLWREDWRCYVRPYTNGMALVNPTADNPPPIELPAGEWRMAIPAGGGTVAEDGAPSGSLTLAPVTAIDLEPYDAVVLVAGAASDDPAPPTALNLRHRQGQTFITWQELAGLSGERYRIYRHNQLIGPSTLHNAALIAEVPENSSYFTLEAEHERSVQTRFIIDDLGPELEPGTGLFVATAPADAAVYYAVTTVTEDGESQEFSAGNRSESPINEAVTAPAPVCVWQAPGGYGRIYTQWMPYAEWNVTFDGYAYNYNVAVPDGYDGSSPLPLYVYMQGWGGRYDHDEVTPYGWPAIVINVDDPHQTWYYGHSATQDYSQIAWGEPAQTGPIANFTEWRILRAIFDTVRNPYYNVDTTRIYAHGQSMGGSGSLTLAMRYPTVFAGVYGGQPMTDYRQSALWREDLQWKLGLPTADLPIINLGPFAEHLQRYDGTSVWSWLDHPANLLSRRGDAMAFISVHHGSLDDVIDWTTQGNPFYSAADSSRQGWSGAVEVTGHTWTGFAAGCPNFVFDAFTFRSDESFPALSAASGNGPLPPGEWGAGPFYYNTSIEWSSSWHDFAGPPVDSWDHYEIALRSLAGEQTADVTPRRLQALFAAPGNVYTWQNQQLPGGGVVASGDVSADGDGLITLNAFSISEAGNRLVLDLTFYHTPTPTPWGTPAPTPTPTPVGCGSLGARVIMASSEYRSGDELRVDVELCNPGAALSAIPLFSFFDVYGELYFWPSWTHYSANTSAGQADWQIQPAVPTGASYVNILSAELPEMTESIPGVVWYGGMTNPSITEVLGDVGSHEFSLVP